MRGGADLPLLRAPRFPHGATPHNSESNYSPSPSHCPLTDVMAAAAAQVQRVTPATTTTTTSQVEKPYENAGGAGTFPRRGA
jgi:hypothetical protein